jgi:hypothetical protein
MILSKNVVAQGTGADVRRLGQPRLIPRRILSAATSDATAQVCVLVGAIAAPVLSLIGWVGLMLPATTALHYAAPGLLACAMIGLATALIGAHNAKDAPKPDAEQHTAE